MIITWQFIFYIVIINFVFSSLLLCYKCNKVAFFYSIVSCEINTTLIWCYLKWMNNQLNNQMRIFKIYMPTSLRSCFYIFSDRRHMELRWLSLSLREIWARQHNADHSNIINQFLLDDWFHLQHYYYFFILFIIYV